LIFHNEFGIVYELSNLNKVDDKRYSDSFLISVWERLKNPFHPGNFTFSCHVILSVFSLVI